MLQNADKTRTSGDNPSESGAGGPSSNPGVSITAYRSGQRHHVSASKRL